MSESKQDQETNLKENKCAMFFYCYHSEKDPCVYFSGNNYDCKYVSSCMCHCTSAVAQSNRITLRLKELKGD
ncbi:MAG: hypothetical protein GY870_12715 [archaeon]|nr:hypothetical protein [archaeon]